MPTHQARTYRRAASVKRSLGRADAAERYEWADLLEREGVRIGAIDPAAISSEARSKTWHAAPVEPGEGKPSG